MDTVLLGASVGAILAYALLTGARRHAARQATRQLEAALFARRQRRDADDLS
jgi:hypothetical protein